MRVAGSSNEDPLIKNIARRIGYRRLVVLVAAVIEVQFAVPVGVGGRAHGEEREREQHFSNHWKNRSGFFQ